MYVYKDTNRHELSSGFTEAGLDLGCSLFSNRTIFSIVLPQVHFSN